jgi:hypothetical protein
MTMPKGYKKDSDTGRWYYNSVSTEATSNNDNVKSLLSDLKTVYDRTLDRRKTLTSQAQNLISFTGIIQTVLIGLIVALATNKDARALLLESQNYYILIILAGIGFIFYIATTLFSLLAFREPKYTPAPQLPVRKGERPIETINYFFLHPDKYNNQMIARQYWKATEDLQKTNDMKYLYLIIATICLIVGIIATILGGFIIIKQ